jgi:hypothetical protein
MVSVWLYLLLESNDIDDAVLAAYASRHSPGSQTIVAGGRVRWTDGRGGRRGDRSHPTRSRQSKRRAADVKLDK